MYSLRRLRDERPVRLGQPAGHAEGLEPGDRLAQRSLELGGHPDVPVGER